MLEDETSKYLSAKFEIELKGFWLYTTTLESVSNKKPKHKKTIIKIKFFLSNFFVFIDLYYILNILNLNDLLYQKIYLFF